MILDKVITFGQLCEDNRLLADVVIASCCINCATKELFFFCKVESVFDVICEYVLVSFSNVDILRFIRIEVFDLSPQTNMTFGSLVAVFLMKNDEHLKAQILLAKYDYIHTFIQF